MSLLQILGLILLAPPALLLIILPFTSYRLGRHEVEVLVLGVVVRRVMLGNIDDVLVGARFPGELWPTRCLFSGRFLAIRRKRSLLRYLVLTPRHPERLRANIYYALGWNPNEGQADPAATASASAPESGR